MSNPIFQGISLFDSVGAGLLVDGSQNLYVNLHTAIPAGSNTIGAVTQASGPWTINLTQVDGVALGSPSNFGTSPGAVEVIGVNSALFANVSGTQTALTATGTSLNVNITGGSASGVQYVDGTAETAGAFTGTVAMLYNGTDVVGLRGDASDNLLVNVNVALPAGTNTIGKVDILGNAGSILDAAPGAATPAHGLLVGGSDGTDFRPINSSTSGTVIVQDAVDAEAGSINFFGAVTAAAGVSISSATPVLSIQTNSGSVIFRLRGIDVMALNGAACRFELVRNGTLTGSSFTSISGTNMKQDTSATSISGGTVVKAGFVAEQKVRDENFAIYIANGTPGDTLSLVLAPSSASSVVGAAIEWSEQSAAL